MTSFKVGADPEAFLYIKQQLMPAFEFVAGEKGKSEDVNEFGGVHSDNIMLEFNMNPTPNISDVYNNIGTTRVIADWLHKVRVLVHDTQQLIATRAEVNVNEVNISFNPSIIIPYSFQNKYKNNNKFNEFGCDPDYNAFLLKKNKPPQIIQRQRHAGGHIHLSCEKDVILNNIKIKEAMAVGDISLEIILHMLAAYNHVVYYPEQKNYGYKLSDVYDTNTTRAMSYGVPGNYRIKNYGAYVGTELRSFSNLWMNELMSGNISSVSGFIYNLLSSYAYNVLLFTDNIRLRGVIATQTEILQSIEEIFHASLEDINSAGIRYKFIA